MPGSRDTAPHLSARTQTIDSELALWGTPDCVRWRAAILARHAPISRELANGFLHHAQSVADPIVGNALGNAFLRRADDRLRLGIKKVSVTVDDETIKQIAKTNAQACESLFTRLAAKRDFDATAAALQRYVENAGLSWPVTPSDNDTAEQRRGKEAGAIARAKDARWWRRQLRTIAGRKVESVLRDAGVVHKRAAPYVSDWAFKRWKATQKRNADLLENLDAIADDGTELPLIECVAASVSNPINRRNELMTRMAGWEAVADAMGLGGALLTLTCPSAFHARQHSSGGANPKYNGATPTEGMGYLNGVWARIRAAWAREGIKTFGFRICEPHHDGTPHFHFLLFFAPDQMARARTIYAQHAMKIDGDEPGATKHRWDWMLIDKSKGTATGYVAKYVSKNIDGYGFGADELDEEGETFANDGALRVRAWASLWGIRQFQQIGSISVIVWRELRRRTQPLEAWEPEQIEALRRACDEGNWARFVELMGGAFVRRDDQTLRALHVVKKTPGLYGDEIRRILGVVMRGGGRVVTRFKTWEVLPRWLRNRQDLLSREGLIFALDPPWSSVNNCTLAQPTDLINQGYV